MPPLRLFVVELPQRQQRALAFPELIALVLPVLEILRDVVVGILIHHALHHPHRLRHRRARHELVLLLFHRKRAFARFVLVPALLRRELVFLLYLALQRHALLVLHVGVVDGPLRGALGKRARRGGLRLALAVAHGVVHRLRRAVCEVKLIPELFRVVPDGRVCVLPGVRLGVGIALLGVILPRRGAGRRAARRAGRRRLLRLLGLLGGGRVDGGDPLGHGLSLQLLQRHLPGGLVGRVVQQKAVARVVHDELIHRRLKLERAFLFVVPRQVRGRVRVVRGELLRHLLVQLLLRQHELVLRPHDDVLGLVERVHRGRLALFQTALLLLLLRAILLPKNDVGGSACGGAPGSSRERPRGRVRDVAWNGGERRRSVGGTRTGADGA